MEQISIIVPIYNVEKYLNRCVRSIVNQSYTDLEIILVDDGSTDECPTICDNWAKKDSRIKVIHKQNGGLSSARNAGIDIAAGQYLVLVDSDDYIAENMVAILYSALIKHDADLALCSYIKGNEDSYCFGDSNDFDSEEKDPLTAIHQIYNSSEDAQLYVSAWGKLYKKELFNGIRYPEGKIFEDIYVTHRILYRCERIAVVSNKLVYYYQHPASIMNSQFSIKKLDYLQALKERVEFFREHKLYDLSEIAYDDYLHSLVWEYSRVRDILHDDSARKDIINRFRSVYKKGYASKRYPSETSLFLRTFSLNPELIIVYWKFNGKLRKLIGNRHETAR